MKLKFFLAVFLFTFSIKTIWAQRTLLNINNNLESVTDSFPWINQSTKVNGDAFSGNYYSSTDSLMQFGLGYKGAFPLSCRNKNLHINFSEFVRANVIGKEFFMVVNVSFGDSLIVWESKNISAKLLKPNLWTEMKDEIDIPSSLTGEGYNFVLYLWNKDGKSKVDIDDLKIDFEEKNMPSFLPNGFKTNNIDFGWKNLSSNENFKLFYNKDVKQVQILNTIGDTIINSLALFSDWTDLKKIERKQSWNYQFNLIKDSVSEKGSYILLSANDDIIQSEVTILVENKNNISFKINSVLLRPVTLYRHSLIFEFNLPVSEVYKKSTLTDSTHLKDEYWLNKEGFKLSNGQSSIVLYHPKEVSSLQLDVKNKLAIINLDFSADHPLLHFPLLKKSENKFEDYSASVYSKGDILKSSFTLYSVPSKFSVAHLLSNSYGYLSSFVWTEHADYTDLRTQKAVYLGSEKINKLDDATGGFLKYSIPVTKSIFYANPDNVDNSDKAGFMTGPVANFKETVGYRDFLKLLSESGIEICLHTPDHFTSSKKLLSEALDVTKREFFPCTWIDHGYDNSKKSNRENLSTMELILILNGIQLIYGKNTESSIFGILIMKILKFLKNIILIPFFQYHIRVGMMLCQLHYIGEIKHEQPILFIGELQRLPTQWMVVYGHIILAIFDLMT